MKKSFIIGSGMYAPERVVSNEEIAPLLGLEPEDIFKFSGIRNRRWVSRGTKCSTIAALSLKEAIANANLRPQEIDYLIFGTMTPDRFIPGSATAVQKELELPEIPCLDTRAACCNALYGLQVATALVKSGVAKNVGLCLADIQSVGLDLTPESGKISMLFGDGASSLIVSEKESETALEVIDIMLAANGSYIDDLGILSPGTESFGQESDNKNFIPRMKGQSVILQASRRITDTCRKILVKNDLTMDSIRWLVPHQANANLLNQIASSLKFSMGNGGLVSIIEDFGNTSSASMGMALDRVRRSEKISSGDYFLMPAFAAGFTWGAGICRAV